jgi:outer membrane protein
MKNNSTIIHVILALAIIALYVLYFTGNKNSQTTQPTTETQSDNAPIKVAFVKLDSVLINYDLAKKLNDDFNTKQDAYTKEYGAKRIDFEKQASAFQEKLQRGGFLTQERATQERDRLMGIQQEIQKLDYDLSNKLQDMQKKINQQVIDSISNYVKIYNADKKYDMIFSNANLLEGSDQHNITREVIAALNKRYHESTK